MMPRVLAFGVVATVVDWHAIVTLPDGTIALTLAMHGVTGFLAARF